jgi:hypothetical protein
VFGENESNPEKALAYSAVRQKKLHISSRNPHWWSISVVAILEISWHPEPTQTHLTPIPNGNNKCGSCAQCNITIKTSFFRHIQLGKSLL